MKAVIVAAGRGTRLEAATNGAPKCLVQVGGRALITRALDALEQAGVLETLIVVGHRREEIEQAVEGRARTIVNPFYATTNNMASLWLAVPHVWDAPFLYMHSDIAFDARLLSPLMKSPPMEDASLVVDEDRIDEEAMKVRLEGGRFVESSKAIPLGEAAGEWTGIARFTPRAARAFHAHAGALLVAGEHQVYDTAAFNRMAADGTRFQIHPTRGLPWIEIDTPRDLEEAHSLFQSTPPRGATQ